jgi:hypothetical protein
MMVMIGYCFTAFYTTELIGNMLTHGKYFFRNAEAAWNMFDFIIVSVAIMELLVKAAGGKMTGTSFLRIVKFLRVSRVLRMFSAMRSFKEVKIMVDSLAGSFNIFTWCSGLFLLLLSLFSVFFVQGVATYLEANPDLDPVDKEELIYAFGSVSASILSLFKCGTGGDDWSQFYYLVKPLGAQYDYLFLFFVGFYSFAFLNVISGVFCEKAMSLAKPSQQEMIHRRYEKEYDDARGLFELLYRVLGDEAQGKNQTEVAFIDSEKFARFVADPDVEKYFEIRGVKASSARRFFALLCELNNTDKVDLPTFVSACVKLDGFASSIDMHVISVRQLHGLHQMETMQGHQIAKMERKMAAQALQHSAMGYVDRKPSYNDLPTRTVSGGMMSPKSRDSGGDKPLTARTTWSEVEAKMQKQFTTIADEIKDQLSSLQQEMRSPPPGEAQEMKMGMIAPHTLGAGGQTPRTLSRNLMAEAEKAKEAQERLEALKHESEEAAKQAQSAITQLEMQKRNEEELQHRLMQQERVHERTIKEVVSQTHSREAELKMLVKSQAVKLEQLQYQVQTGKAPPPDFPPKENSIASSASDFWNCTGTRDRGPAGNRPATLVDPDRGPMTPNEIPNLALARPGPGGMGLGAPSQPGSHLDQMPMSPPGYSDSGRDMSGRPRYTGGDFR